MCFCNSLVRYGPSVSDVTRYFVDSVKPSELDPKGGTVVSLLGRGLGVAELMSVVTVKIGAEVCDTPQASSSDGTVVVCRAGRGVAGPSYALSVTIGNASLAPIVLMYDSMFEYSGPKVERIQPSVIASVNASTVITIYGRNFGAAEDHKITGHVMTSGGVVHLYVTSLVCCVLCICNFLLNFRLPDACPSHCGATNRLCVCRPALSTSQVTCASW